MTWCERQHVACEAFYSEGVSLCVCIWTTQQRQTRAGRGCERMSCELSCRKLPLITAPSDLTGWQLLLTSSVLHTDNSKGPFIELLGISRHIFQTGAAQSHISSWSDFICLSFQSWAGPNGNLNRKWTILSFIINQRDLVCKSPILWEPVQIVLGCTAWPPCLDSCLSVSSVLRSAGSHVSAWNNRSDCTVLGI